MKNKLLAFILVIMLMFGVIGCSDPISSQSTTPPSPPTTEPNQGSTVAPENSKYPDYLNLSGYPIVKDDVEPITLSLLTTRVDSSLASTDINSLWWFEYIKEKMNIQFEAEEVAGDSIDERKSLMFATNQLPDIVMGAGLWLTNNEVVTYGQQEGMVINWSEYLTEELMPNALASMGEYSDAWTAATSLDGNIYALPQIRPVEKYQGTMLPAAAFAFINQKWLDDCGLENPTTLNGFIDTLRAFKELKDDSIPLVSVDNLLNGYLWTALGFNTSAFDYGESPALKNNELVLPCATEEYDIFVSTLHTMFDEGLISPDYFTMDSTTARAYIANDLCGVMADYAPYLSVPDTFIDWVSCNPLDGAKTCAAAAYNLGGFYSANDTEYPEVIARLADYLYTDEGAVLFQNGPMAGSEETMGIIGGWYYNDNGELTAIEIDNGEADSFYEYQYQYGSVTQVVGGLFANVNATMHQMAGLPVKEKSYDINDGDDNYRMILHDAWQNNIDDVRLPKPYLQANDLEKVTDLNAVIGDYVKNETSKFVIGTRSLDTLDEFHTQLKTLGIEELIDIYQRAYEGFLATLK